MVSDATATLGEQQFVALTTFKRNGDAVSSPMWIGRDGPDLFVWTPADSWKVKRVRNDPRVLLAPCGRFGKPVQGAGPVAGTAVVVSDAATVERLRRVIQRKYGIGFWIITTIEKIVARGPKSRVILRIALTD